MSNGWYDNGSIYVTGMKVNTQYAREACDQVAKNGKRSIFTPIFYLVSRLNNTIDDTGWPG